MIIPAVFSMEKTGPSVSRPKVLRAPERNCSGSRTRGPTAIRLVGMLGAGEVGLSIEKVAPVT